MSFPAKGAFTQPRTRLTDAPASPVMRAGPHAVPDYRRAGTVEDENGRGPDVRTRT